MTDQLRETPWYRRGPGRDQWLRRPMPGPLHLIGSGQASLRVVLRRSAWDDIEGLHAAGPPPAPHAAPARPAASGGPGAPERAGLLAGRPCVDDRGPFILIEGVVPAPGVYDPDSGFPPSPAAWDELEAAMRRRFPAETVVGWFIVRPGRGAALTDRDRSAARRFFPEPWHITYVIDPVREKQALFHWSGGRLQPLPGFWVWDDGVPEVAVAAVSAADGAAAAGAGDSRGARGRFGPVLAAACLLLTAWLVLPLPGSLSSLRHHVQNYTRETEQLQQELTTLRSRHEALQRAVAALDEDPPDPGGEPGQGGPVDARSVLAAEPEAPASAQAPVDAGAALQAAGTGTGADGAPGPGPEAGPDAAPAGYVVRPGDTLWSISARLLGNPYDYVRVALENELTNPDLILPGWELRLPPAGPEESGEEPAAD